MYHADLGHTARLAHKLRSWVVVSFAAFASGCIIPTPLHEVGGEVNLPPSINEQLTDPAFGLVFLPLSKEFTVVVDDPNVADDLRARLFTLHEPNQHQYLSIELTNPAIDPEIPTRRRFTFPSSGSPCATWAFGAASFTLSIVVADRNFTTATDPMTAYLSPNGLTDENSWEIRCQ